MTIRQFVFCDFCNPQGLRSIEVRRGAARDKREGRRISDGRAWFEGDISEAIAVSGWVAADDERHICPDCQDQ